MIIKFSNWSTRSIVLEERMCVAKRMYNDMVNPVVQWKE